MSESQVSGTGDRADSRRKSGGRVVWTLLLLLAAIVVAVAAFYFVGGMDYVGTLLPSSSPPKSSAGGSAPSAVATSASTPVQSEFARRMYVEQLESHAVLGRMADGEVESIVIKGVQPGESTATINILAAFHDGTSADGAMTLVKSDNAWYLFSLTGLRKGSKPGLSGSIAGFNAIEASHTVEAAASALGIETFDQGVIDTLMAEQPKHQALVKAIFDGTYNAINLGTPTIGVGTVTIPITLTGPQSQSSKNEVVLIRKEIDGQTRTFLTTLGQ